MEYLRSINNSIFFCILARFSLDRGVLQSSPAGYLFNAKELVHTIEYRAKLVREGGLGLLTQSTDEQHHPNRLEHSHIFQEKVYDWECTLVIWETRAINEKRKLCAQMGYCVVPEGSKAQYRGVSYQGVECNPPCMFLSDGSHKDFFA